ncbi:hypothetical protein [Streptomyces sp. B22F1]|uniref:hypothetical protein n=1 Tax=Streptomyces sp. B22F1 TaxID=3153566 RepID=UPI00325E65AC
MALEDLDDVGDGVLRQQHAAEDGLLGVQILRGYALEGGGGAGTPGVIRRGLIRPAVPVLAAQWTDVPGHGVDIVPVL